MVPGEDEAARSILEQQIISELAPQGPIEKFWVSQIIDSAWQVRRLIVARDRLYDTKVTELFAWQLNSIVSITGTGSPDPETLKAAAGYAAGTKEYVQKIEAIYDGPVKLDQFLSDAYLNVNDQVLLIERAIDLIIRRHDVALANIYKKRSLSAAGEPRSIDRRGR